MSSFTYNSSFIFIVFSTFLLSSINTRSVPVSYYEAFIDYLTKNNCTMPEEVDIKFLPVPDPTKPFSYLSSPLSECNTTDAIKENNGAKFLCDEIFDVLQNITCVEYNMTLPKIESKPLSQTICIDFKSMKGMFSEKNHYLSGKLADDLLCKILCSEEKYALLCKMLFWSHDIQAKIKSAIANFGLVQNTPISNEMTITNEITIKETNADSNADNEKNTIGINKVEDHGTGTSSTVTQTERVEINNLSTTSSQVELDRKISITSENTKMSVSSQTESRDDNQKVVNDLQSVDSNKKLQPVVNIDQMETKNDMHPNDKMVGKVSENILTSTVSLIPEVNNVKDTSKTTSTIVLQNKGNNVTKSNTSTTKAKGISQNSGINNNLVGSNTEGENENAKQTNVITAANDKKVEKPELADTENPESSKGSPDIDLKQIESTTLQIILPEKDKKVEHQEDPDQYPEEYNENEKEDYPKAEYDNSFNPPVKNKELGDKSSVKENANQMLNSYETFISSRNGIGHSHDNIPIIPSFPEQEDSHFFFYFLSIVLILMAGYLIFHNKQKIIALIVEGRHERRRRSHGAGYKKLETK